MFSRRRRAEGGPAKISRFGGQTALFQGCGPKKWFLIRAPAPAFGVGKGSRRRRECFPGVGGPRGAPEKLQVLGADGPVSRGVAPQKVVSDSRVAARAHVAHSDRTRMVSDAFAEL